MTNNISENVIEVTNLNKTFHSESSSRTIKESFINLGNSIRGKSSGSNSKGNYTALKEISFSVKKGQFFGIVGKNGSGKSTLLKILAGVYPPSSGTVSVKGKLTPFIELGVGFNPELVGRDNVYLNGALLGFTRSQMDEMYDDIVDFAELNDFMDTKLKNYSSGMQVRLAFSVAIRAQTDILLIDEVLAVGDAAFQQKCFDYFETLKKNKKTVVFVSHDRAALEKFCTQGVLIDDGKIKKSGPIKSVLSEYNKVVLRELASDHNPEEKDTKTSKQKNNLGQEYAKIIKTYTTMHSTETNKFEFGQGIGINFSIKILKNVKDPIVGVTIWKRNVANAILATNTLIDGVKLGEYKTGDVIAFSLIVNELLNDGEYSIEPAVANASGTVMYDQKPHAARFYISGSSNPHSTIASTNKISFKKG